MYISNVSDIVRSIGNHVNNTICYNVEQSERMANVVRLSIE